MRSYKKLNWIEKDQDLLQMLRINLQIKPRHQIWIKRCVKYMNSNHKFLGYSADVAFRGQKMSFFQSIQSFVETRQSATTARGVFLKMSHCSDSQPIVDCCIVMIWNVPLKSLQLFDMFESNLKLSVWFAAESVIDV